MAKKPFPQKKSLESKDDVAQEEVETSSVEADLEQESLVDEPLVLAEPAAVVAEESEEAPVSVVENFHA